MQPQMRQLGPVETHEIINEPGAPYVVLFHGYGANAFDLMPFSQMLLRSHKVNWLFPQGILDLDIGYGMMGKAWFHIDIAAFERAMTTGQFRDLSRDAPAGFVEARDSVMAMLQKLDVPLEKIVLGGFSQGAMLATDIAMRLPAPPAGLAILSGTLVDEENWRQVARQREGMAFFQSHGKIDPVLPFSMAEKLHELLMEAGLKGDLKTFSGGHEIPQDVLFELDIYLESMIQKM